MSPSEELKGPFDARSSLRDRAEALLQYVSDGTDGLMTPGMIHLADARDVVEVVMAYIPLYDAACEVLNAVNYPHETAHDRAIAEGAALHSLENIIRELEGERV